MMNMSLILTTDEQVSLEEQFAVWEQQHIDTLFSNWDKSVSQ